MINDNLRTVRLLPRMIYTRIRRTVLVLTKVRCFCRKKRKWDQPDESLLSAGVTIPGIFPLGNMGYLPRPAVPFSTSNINPLQVIQVPLQQHAAAIVQKLVQVSLCLVFKKTYC